MKRGDISHWWSEIGLPDPRPPLDGDTAADVCIVGAGYTGLWTAWYLKAIDKMIGILADFDGLRIAPSAPAAWKEYRLRKRFRGMNYHFTFHHTSGKSEVKSVTVNGKALAPAKGEYKLPLPARNPGRPIVVEVEL